MYRGMEEAERLPALRVLALSLIMMMKLTLSSTINSLVMDDDGVLKCGGELGS